MSLQRMEFHKNQLRSFKGVALTNFVMDIWTHEQTDIRTGQKQYVSQQVGEIKFSRKLINISKYYICAELQISCIFGIITTTRFTETQKKKLLMGFETLLN